MIEFVISENYGINEIKNLGFTSFENLNVFDKKLLYYQDLCLECGDEVKKYKIKNDDIFTVKKIIEASDDEYSVFFFENCFFDFSLHDILKIKDDFSTGSCYLNSNDNLVFAIVRNSKLKELFLKDFSFSSVESILKAYCIEKKTDFYYKFLDTYSSYKELLFDILNDNTNVLLPSLAKGVFTDGKLPEGDYTIIPPVYISDESQIEKGSVIGPSSIILKNTLVAGDSMIIKSVLCENTFISNECVIENSICGKNSSVKRGGAALNGCVLGKDSVIGNDMYIENNAVILPETYIFNPDNKVNFNIDFDINSACFNSLDVVTACRLGVALGKVFGSPSICVGNDENLRSSTIKMAFLSGLCSVGCDCYDVGSSFLSKLFYTSYFCKLQCSCYFTCSEDGVSLKIFNGVFKEINSSDFYNLVHCFKNLKQKDTNIENIKKIKQIKGIGKLYVRDLKNVLPDKISRKYDIKCNNLSIKKIIENIFKLKDFECKKTDYISFFINDFGTELSCFLDKKTYNHTDLISVMESICDDLYCDSYISKLCKNDAIVLLFRIISFFEENILNVSKFKENLEKLIVVDKEFFYTNHTGKLISKLIYNDFSEYKNGKIYIINNDEKISFKINPSNKSLRLLVKSYNSEASREILNEIGAILGDINNL